MLAVAFRSSAGLTAPPEARNIGSFRGNSALKRRQRVISKPLIARLLAGVLLLPIAILLVVAVAGLLSGMQDAAGAWVMNRVALGLGIVWVLGLIALLLALAVHSLADSSSADRGEPPGGDGE